MVLCLVIFFFIVLYGLSHYLVYKYILKSLNTRVLFQFFNLIKQPHETYESMGYFTSYYLSIYDQHEEKKWFLSWNWSSFGAAFLQMEVLWLLYRRMYFFAFLDILYFTEYKNLHKNNNFYI